MSVKWPKNTGDSKKKRKKDEGVARDKSSEAATCAPGGAAGIGLSECVGADPGKEVIPLY